MVARGLTVPALILHINLGSSLHTKHCTTNTAHYKYCTSTWDPLQTLCTLQTLHITNTVHYKHCTLRTTWAAHAHYKHHTFHALHSAVNTAQWAEHCTLHNGLHTAHQTEKTAGCTENWSLLLDGKMHWSKQKLSPIQNNSLSLHCPL